MRERTPQSRASMARVSSGAEQVRRSHGSWWHRAYGAESAASRSCGPAAANTADLQPLTGAVVRGELVPCGLLTLVRGGSGFILT